MLDVRLFAIGSSLPGVEESQGKVVEEFARFADAGIRAYQMRQQSWNDRMRFNTALQLVRASARIDARIVINERADIAALADAAGVHLPEAGIKITEAKQIAKKSFVGMSCHSISSALKAQEGAADYIFFGPIYETESKRAFGLPLGMEKLRDVCAHVSIPVFAIGGITPARAAECRAAGAHGVAVIGALANPNNLSVTVREFQDALGGL